MNVNFPQITRVRIVTGLRFFCVLAALFAGIRPAVGQGAGAGGLVLEDLINRNWTNELVTFPLTAAQRSALAAGQGLAGPDGKAVPYQLDGETLAFQANLGPYERKEYVISKQAEAPKTDLRVVETADQIELSNERTGVRIRKKLTGNEGPIAGIRLSDGTWTSGSRLELNPAEFEYKATVTANGPVFSDVECQLIRGEARWSLKFRLQAGEPVVLVDEVTTLGEGDSWEVELGGGGFVPNSLLRRAGWRAKPPFTRGCVYATKFAPAKNGAIFDIQPWVQWWREYAAKWVGLYNEEGSTLLMLGARDGEVWAKVREEATNRLILGSGAQPFTLFEKNGRTFVKLPLVACRRNWMFGSFNKEETLAILEKKGEKGREGEQDQSITPLPQEIVIKYEFPLQKVKELVLDWTEAEEHPRLFITKNQIEKLQADVASETKPVEVLAPSEGKKKKPPQVKIDSAQETIKKAMLASNAVMNVYLKQNLATSTTSLGMAPHHSYRNVVAALIAIDSALAVETITPEERKRLRAQAAFVGYTVMRDDFWSPERGYANHLNMSSYVAGDQIIAGSLLASHPQGKAWAEKGLTTLKSQLDDSSGRDGGWQEGPHYAVATFDTLLGGFKMAENSGYADLLYHPNIKKIGEWFAKISTPPDSRFEGKRHLPHIGHTYQYESSGIYGLLAALWKDKDPQYAANMRWMWEQHGKPTDPGIGGSFPMFGAYREKLLQIAETVEPVAPNYGSEWFRDTGVIFRSGFPSDRETMMTLIAGKNHDHYDKDSGSFTLWGKGRIVSDDFGYYAYAPPEDHNMVTSKFSESIKRFFVSSFASGEWADYLKGAATDWTRQIVFVKDADPLKPNYFVVRDSFPKPGAATSRTFFVAKSIELSERGALVIGKEDVDTDVFYAFPSELKLSVQETTREGHGAKGPGGPQGKMKLTQLGLIASVKNEPGFMAVIYPRLKTEKAPTFTSMGEGRVVKVVSEAGTDYVFLSEKPFSFEEEGIAFEGASGSVQIRKDEVRLSLGDAGKIKAKGHELTSEGPLEKSWKN